jgi:hypothetical protein
MRRVVISEALDHENSCFRRPDHSIKLCRPGVFGVSWKRIVVLSIVLQVLDVWILPAATSFALVVPHIHRRSEDESTKRVSALASISSSRTNHLIEADDLGGFQREQMSPVTNTTTTPQITPTSTSKRHHTSIFGRKQNHPTSYEEHPVFKGPLVLPKSDSTSDARERIGRYYYNKSRSSIDSTVSQFSRPPLPPKPLSPESSTKIILQRILEQLAYQDAPLDAKEVAESIEFYLRTYKRMLGATRRRKPQQRQHTDEAAATQDDEREDSVVTVRDLCSGHGFTGMLYAACNPPKLRQGRFERMNVVLVDKTEPPSHKVLRDCLAEICPWIQAGVVHKDESCGGDEDNDSPKKRRNTIRFVESTLEEFASDSSSGEEETNSHSNASASSSSYIVLSTHACGSLTDRVIEYCCGTTNSSEPISALAVMPCCYTGTDEGVPYGIRRALGVSMSADVRRSFVLQDAGYHVDFATIPSEITPMNRIIVGE